MMFLFGKDILIVLCVLLTSVTFAPPKTKCSVAPVSIITIFFLLSRHLLARLFKIMSNVFIIIVLDAYWATLGSLRLWWVPVLCFQMI